MRSACHPFGRRAGDRSPGVNPGWWRAFRDERALRPRAEAIASFPVIPPSFIRYGLRLCGTVAPLSFGFALFGCAEEPAEPALFTPPPSARFMEPARSVAPSAPPPPPRPRPACLTEPPPDAGVSPPSSLGEDAGHVANAERVIAQLRPAFRLCYNKELAIDPVEQGCVTIVVRIAPDGT
jgi:hypothetical protein